MLLRPLTNLDCHRDQCYLGDDCDGDYDQDEYHNWYDFNQVHDDDDADDDDDDHHGDADVDADGDRIASPRSCLSRG